MELEKTEERNEEATEGYEVEISENGEVIIGEGPTDAGSSPTGDKSGEQVVGEPSEIPTEYLDRYKDSSREDLLKQSYNAQKMIDRQANELGELRKKVGGAAVEQDSYSSQYERKLKEIAQLEKKLSKLDEVMDSEQSEKIRNKLSAERVNLSELKDKSFEERVNRTVTQRLNAAKLKELSNEISQEYGLQSHEVNWSGVMDRAMKMSGDGEITRAHLLSSMMLEHPETEILMRGAIEQKTRSAISKASEGTTPLNKRGGYTGGTRKVPLSKLSQSERIARLSKLSDKQLDRLISELED
ncbi:MAG: hypothetical protein ACXQTJ_06325 [Candidatus Syntropharchaeales archaeon]